MTVLIEDSVETKEKSKKQLIAKHGLSILVEAKSNDAKVCVLMDTGPSPEALLNNVDIIGVNPRKIDAIVLSHGHCDHTDGLIGILKSTRKHVPVVAHPKSFDPKFAVSKHKLKYIGATFPLQAIEKARGIPLLATNPVKISEGITTTGEIERITTYKKLRDFFTIEERRFIEDSIKDDQALVINLKGKGLVVMTGCAHAGIVNTIKHAQKIMKKEKVYAVLGGFHLIDATRQEVQTTVKHLRQFDIELLGPCHCTGKKAMGQLVKAFGDKCHLLKTGDTLRF